MANKYTDVQKDLMEDLYLAGADRAYILLEQRGKLYANKVSTLVQKGILSVVVTADTRLTYKLMPLGIIETHKAFNTSRS